MVVVDAVGVRQIGAVVVRRSLTEPTDRAYAYFVMCAPSRTDLAALAPVTGTY
jgi:hypothetical protein